MTSQEQLNQLRQQVEKQVKKEVRYRRQMTVILTGLAFLLLVSWIFAFLQKTEADAQRQIAVISVMEAADCRKSAEEERRQAEQQIESALMQAQIALQKAQEEAKKKK